jgi:hypothetical protein
MQVFLSGRALKPAVSKAALPIQAQQEPHDSVAQSAFPVVEQDRVR